MVVGYVVAEALSPASSHEPVDVGVPLVAVSAQMRLLEVALWTRREQDRVNQQQSRCAGGVAAQGLNAGNAPNQRFVREFRFNSADEGSASLCLSCGCVCEETHPGSTQG